MSVDTFIPEIWNAQLLVDLRNRHVFGQSGITNKDYEGDISDYGDTVRINHLGDPTIGDYVKNTTNIAPETLETEDQLMVIDQSKYFAFQVDDIDQRQARDGGQLLTKGASNAAYQLAQTADVHLATRMAAGAGTVMTPRTLTSPDDAYRLMREFWVTHETNNVPSESRFVIVSPDVYSLLMADKRFTDASQYGDSRMIRNGEVGSVIGFRVLNTNNLPSGAGTGSFVISGHPMGMTWAEQIAKTEAYKQEARFNDAVKGLHLYGSKVVRPEVLIACDITVDEVVTPSP